jgi:ubiquinone/menaquinone biosynthesis C-methylase UbiE
MNSWLYNEFQQVGTDFSDPAVVATYDRKQRSTAEKAQALVQRLGIARGQVVIDLGCGTGTFAMQAALAGASVHAVDVSPLMLRYVQQQAAAAEVLEQMQFHHQGFLTYQHPPNSADFVVTQAALHHLPDFWKMVALLRIAQMLRLNGVFYLWDAIYSFPPSQYETQLEAWIQRASGGWTSEDFATHIREEYTTFSWAIERMLTDAGFGINSVQYPTNTIAEYICHTI